MIFDIVFVKIQVILMENIQRYIGNLYYLQIKESFIIQEQIDVLARYHFLNQTNITVTCMYMMGPISVCKVLI